MIKDEGGYSPLWWCLPRVGGPRLYKKKRQVEWAMKNKPGSSVPLRSLLQLLPWFPSTVDWLGRVSQTSLFMTWLGHVSQINLFVPKLLFGHDIYHSNWKQIRAETTEICVCLHCSGLIPAGHSIFASWRESGSLINFSVTDASCWNQARCQVSRRPGKE